MAKFNGVNFDFYVYGGDVYMTTGNGLFQSYQNQGLIYCKMAMLNHVYCMIPIAYIIFKRISLCLF